MSQSTAPIESTTWVRVPNATRRELAYEVAYPAVIDDYDIHGYSAFRDGGDWFVRVYASRAVLEDVIADASVTAVSTGDAVSAFVSARGADATQWDASTLNEVFRVA